jgi:hypothetical protein
MTDWYGYPTNYSNGTEVDGVAKAFFQYPNYILGGYAGLGFTLLIFVITFGLSLAAGSRKALGVAGFITCIFSLYFVRLGMLDVSITFILGIIGLFGIIFGRHDGGNY